MYIPNAKNKFNVIYLSSSWKMKIMSVPSLATFSCVKPLFGPSVFSTFSGFKSLSNLHNFSGFNTLRDSVCV